VGDEAGAEHDLVAHREPSLDAVELDCTPPLGTDEEQPEHKGDEQEGDQRSQLCHGDPSVRSCR
jgi:hypothetical protein